MVGFWGLGGPGGPANPSKWWGASPLTFWKGWRGHRGRPNPKNRPFPVYQTKGMHALLCNQAPPPNINGDKLVDVIATKKIMTKPPMQFTRAKLLTVLCNPFERSTLK
jgi:hypothetical protein